MSTLQEFQNKFDLTMPALCARILARHQKTIRVKKPALAVARLATIIETTLDLANRQGFHSMSLRDLSKESGLSMGALYAYFDSKDTLLMMILGQVVAAVDEVLRQPSLAARSDPSARLHSLLRSHVYLSETLHKWFLFAYMEAKAFSAEGRKLAITSELGTEKMIADILADGVADGSFAVGDINMTAALIKPQLQDWYVKRSKYRRRGITPENFAESLVGFVQNAITPNEAKEGRRRQEA